MRQFVITSHERMTEDVKSALGFITNSSPSVYAIDAYTTQIPLENQLQSVFEELKTEGEIVILADMLAGSVGQTCIPYRNDHVFPIAGFSIPTAPEILSYPQDKKLSEKELRRTVGTARIQLQLVVSTEELENE